MRGVTGRCPAPSRASERRRRWARPSLRRCTRGWDDPHTTRARGLGVDVALARRHHAVRGRPPSSTLHLEAREVHHPFTSAAFARSWPAHGAHWRESGSKPPLATLVRGLQMVRLLTAEPHGSAPTIAAKGELYREPECCTARTCAPGDGGARVSVAGSRRAADDLGVARAHSADHRGDWTLPGLPGARHVGSLADVAASGGALSAGGAWRCWRGSRPMVLESTEAARLSASPRRGPLDWGPPRFVYMR